MESVLLQGAPDASIGTSEAKTSAVQVMHLEMSNDILDELLECIKRGKTPQVLFGKTALIKYDGKSHEIRSKSERFRHELYRQDEEDAEGTWGFSGLINHSLTIENAEDPSAGTDRALEALRNTMASIEQEREARKTTLSTPEFRPSKGATKAQLRAKHLNPILSSNNRSVPSSPGFGPSTPTHVPAPTSAGLDTMFQESAIRKALVHFLATGPTTIAKARKVVPVAPLAMFEKVAKKHEKNEDEWVLLERCYKEIEPWAFNYKADVRQNAIDNAIRAFDRMRLQKDDPHWQKLLRPEERGKGKCLSRLAITFPLAVTPLAKPQSFDRKTGLPKRKEPKKAEKDVVKAKKVEGAKDVKDSKANVTEEKPKIKKSAGGSRTPQVEPRKERLPTKRAAPKPDEQKASSNTAGNKQGKPSAAAKGLLNKPKNLSPLGTSPPFNASDLDRGHPVHKALSAATSPRAGTKRKAEGINGAHKSNGPVKRPHMDSASSSSSSEERPLRLQSQATTSSKATTMKKPLTNGLTNGANHCTPTLNGRPVTPESDSSNSRGSSSPVPLSWRQKLEMARKFNMYYQRYEKLYREISRSVEPPSEKKRAELLEMHRTLQRMKKDVNVGAV